MYGNPRGTLLPPVPALLRMIPQQVKGTAGYRSSTWARWQKVACTWLTAQSTQPKAEETRDAQGGQYASGSAPAITMARSQKQPVSTKKFESERSHRLHQLASGGYETCEEIMGDWHILAFYILVDWSVVQVAENWKALSGCFRKIDLSVPCPLPLNKSCMTLPNLASFSSRPTPCEPPSGRSTLLHFSQQIFQRSLNTSGSSQTVANHRLRAINLAGTLQK